MKELNRKSEFEKMQRMYENSTGIHGHMDLVKFAWNYYNDQIKKFEELRNFWTPSELQRFFSKFTKYTIRKEV